MGNKYTAREFTERFSCEDKKRISFWTWMKKKLFFIKVEQKRGSQTLGHVRRRQHFWAGTRWTDWEIKMKSRPQAKKKKKALVVLDQSEDSKTPQKEIDVIIWKNPQFSILALFKGLFFLGFLVFVKKLGFFLSVKKFPGSSKHRQATSSVVFVLSRKQMLKAWKATLG